MSLLDMLFGRKPKTATVARDACKSSSRKNAHKKAKLRIICRPCAKSCWKSCPNTSTYHWTTSASPKRNKTAWTFLS